MFGTSLDHRFLSGWEAINSLSSDFELIHHFNSYAAEPGPVIDPNKEISKNYMICIQIELNSYSDDSCYIVKLERGVTTRTEHPKPTRWRKLFSKGPVWRYYLQFNDISSLPEFIQVQFSMNLPNYTNLSFSFPYKT